MVLFANTGHTETTNWLIIRHSGLFQDVFFVSVFLDLWGVRIGINERGTFEKNNIPKPLKVFAPSNIII